VTVLLIRVIALLKYFGLSNKYGVLVICRPFLKRRVWLFYSIVIFMLQLYLAIFVVAMSLMNYLHNSMAKTVHKVNKACIFICSIARDLCVKQHSGLPRTRCTSISAKGNQERKIVGI